MDSIHNSFLTGLEPPFASAKGSMVNKKKNSESADNKEE